MNGWSGPLEPVPRYNDAAARKYFPHENARGQRFGQSFETSGDIEVVGVVAANIAMFMVSAVHVKVDKQVSATFIMQAVYVGM